MKSALALLLVTLTLSLPIQKTERVLILHNIKNFETLYSKLVKVMQGSFKTVRIESTGSPNSKHSAYVFKRAIYDMIVVITPRSNDSMSFAEKLELMKFYDEGNNILFLSDSYVVQNWRVLLAQFGFDATTFEGAQNGYYGVQTSTESKRFFVDKSAIEHPKLTTNIRKGLVYQGGAVRLTPYENLISWPLLQAPENALFVSGDSAKQILDSNKMNLIAAAQGTTNKARMAVVGSFKMFSNQFDAESDGDNISFFRNLIQWLKFESQILKIENYSICNLRTGQCGSPLYLPNQHGFSIKFQLIDEDGNFYVPPEGNLSIRITKQVLHMNVRPDIIEENGEKFYFKSFGPIENGSYKVKIIHSKPGYYLDFEENTRMVHAITTHIDRIELFQIEGLPFLIIIFTVMISALNLVRMTVNKKEKKLD